MRERKKEREREREIQIICSACWGREGERRDGAYLQRVLN